MDNNEDERFDITKVVILSGWILTMLVCAATIATALFADQPPTYVKDMAATCLGFLFGAFASMVKDFIKT